MRNLRRPIVVWALVFFLSLMGGLMRWAPGAWADEEPVPQELIPDPDGELKMFDAQGNQVDYRKLHKLTDPYHQSVLKGDFPIDGKHTYFVFTGISDLNSFASSQKNVLFDNATTSIEFFSGTTQVFEPKRWDVKITPVFNFNTVAGNNLSPFVGYQEAFLAVKLADLSPFFDALTIQVGNQGIKNDFEGFIYNDQNRSANLFATLSANEVQPNIFYADRVFKDAVSNLNTDVRRNDQLWGANYVLRDIKPGLDLNMIALHNQDNQLGVIAANKINKNAGVSVNYFGLAVNGVLGRMDTSAGAYYCNGTDSNNIRTGTAQNVEAYMGFIKLDYPINYWKPHIAFVICSGDSNPGDGKATGWDSVNDASNFFGGFFSFYEGQNVVGTNGLAKGIVLARTNSFIPSLRNGNQPSNFVNPGLVAFNAGVDVQLHPKVTLFTNYNSFSFQSNTSSFGTFNAALPGQFGNHVADEINFGLFIRPGLTDDFTINTGMSFTNFDPAFGAAFFGPGNNSVTQVTVKFTTTY